MDEGMSGLILLSGFTIFFFVKINLIYIIQKIGNITHKNHEYYLSISLLHVATFQHER